MTLPLGADLGPLVCGGEQGKEVVGRNEEEEGNWEIGVGSAYFTVRVPSGWGCGPVATVLPGFLHISGEREGAKALFPLHRWGRSL